MWTLLGSVPSVDGVLGIGEFSPSSQSVGRSGVSLPSFVQGPNVTPCDDLIHLANRKYTCVPFLGSSSVLLCCSCAGLECVLQEAASSGSPKIFK
jgi:hypothetical protein